MPEKSKQEVREQNQMVKKILEQQGKAYEDWLYEVQGHFINL